MSVKIFLPLILIIHSHCILDNLEFRPPIKIFQSKKDLSLFKIEDAKVMNEILEGKWRNEERVMMYNLDVEYPRDKSGLEAQINDNFEVVKMDSIVNMLDNGYILTGFGNASERIKENVKEGQFVIYIKEMNSVYIFEHKKDYKYAYYVFKINKFLTELYDKMINDDLYEELYDQIFDLNYKYKISTKNNYKENYVHIYSELRGLYNKYINITEKIDPSQFSYTPTINLETLDYKVLYTTEKKVKKNNLMVGLTIDHEGGKRETDELVKYDKTNIIKRNEWGYEVGIDKNGNIISKAVTVDLPEDGYILSGHGKYIDYIILNLQIGDYVIYKDLHADVYRDTSIQVINLIGLHTKELIEKYNKFMNLKVPLYYDEIAKKINKLTTYYNAIDKDTIDFSIQSYFTIKEFDYESIILEIKYLFTEPNPVEIQSLWHEPNLVINFYNESNKEGILKFLKDVSETGFNRIYLETNQVGVAYYNSSILLPDKIFGQPYDEYKDYLECFIEEAHKLNIEVFVWVQVLRAKDTDQELAPCYKKEWLSKDYYGNDCNFFDSTNPEVHEFLITQLSELVTNYNVDGLEYDYIRYDLSNILEYPENIEDYGYTECSISQFKKLYNYSESEDIKEILKKNESRLEWVEFKKQRITDLLITSKERLRKLNPNLIFTAAVYYDPSYINSFMQDWPRWLDEEIINFVEPMMYQKDNDVFINHDVYLFINAILKQEDEYIKKKVIFGISTVVYGGIYLDYIDQTEFVMNLHSGYAIFCCLYIYTYNKLVTTFKKYNYKSIPYTAPFEKKIEVLTKELIKKIEQYYKTIAKDEDFSNLLSALNTCSEEKTEDSVNKVFDEIKKINDEVIRKNINYAFFKVDNYKVE